MAGCSNSVGRENRTETSPAVSVAGTPIPAQGATAPASGTPAPTQDAQSPVASAAGATVALPETKRPKVVAPSPGVPWQIQFNGDLSFAGAKIVDVDGAGTSVETVSQIHSYGGYAVCYFNAGAYENWRSDMGRFPQAVIGKDMEGWEGEKWLDVRRLDALMPIMNSRMDECAKKGFNAVDPDNVDGWANETGFPLSQEDSATYIRELTKAAHARGMAIGLKNAIGLIPEMADVVDFAVNEQCLAYRECGSYQPFVDRKKAVLHIEYEGKLSAICAKRPEGFSTIRKNMNLDSKLESC